MVKGMNEGHGGFSARSGEVSLFGLCLNPKKRSVVVRKVCLTQWVEGGVIEM